MAQAPRRRLLLDLAQAAAGREGIGVAARIALLLGLDLHGVFVEDEGLLAAAAHPFARQLRLPSHDWATMAAGDLAVEMARAAARLRRMVAAECEALGIGGGFEVRRGDAAACVAGLCDAADMLALGTPESAVGRSIGAFPRAWRAALDGVAPVLLLPPRSPARGGAIALVAGAMAPDVALRLASGAAGDLLVLVPPGEAAAAEAAVLRAREAGLRSATRALRVTTAEAIAEALGPSGEALLVLPRGVAARLAGDGAPRLAAQRCVPVLVGQDAPDPPDASR